MTSTGINVIYLDMLVWGHILIILNPVTFWTSSLVFEMLYVDLLKNEWVIPTLKMAIITLIWNSTERIDCLTNHSHSKCCQSHPSSSLHSPLLRCAGGRRRRVQDIVTWGSRPHPSIFQSQLCKKRTWTLILFSSMKMKIWPLR